LGYEGVGVGGLGVLGGGEGRREGGGGTCIALKKKKKKTDRQYQAIDQVYQFINEALLGVFRILDIWVRM